MKKLFIVLFFSFFCCLLKAQTFENKVLEKYPEVVYIEWDHEDGKIQAEFKHDGKDVDMYFSQEGQWLETKTDYLFLQLPKSLKQSFSNSKYAKWRVDDVDLIERPNAVFYKLELELPNDVEKKILLYPDGKITEIN